MHRIAVTIAAILSIFIVAPASAQIVITQAKAIAGNITPGDTAGYPITLSQPGAYVLGSNLTVPSGIYGIYAGVDNIDIDLNGFVISGGGVATYGLITYKAQGRIHDGVISQFGSSGIYIIANDWTIEDMKIIKNGNIGIYAGDSITVRHSTVSSNNSVGVYLKNKGIIKDNFISGNRLDGIALGSNAIIQENQINDNGSNGLNIGAGGIAIGNVIGNNKDFGIANALPATASLINNTLSYNNDARPFTQIYGGFDISGNVCVGKTCY